MWFERIYMIIIIYISLLSCFYVSGKNDSGTTSGPGGMFREYFLFELKIQHSFIWYSFIYINFISLVTTPTTVPSESTR